MRNRILLLAIAAATVFVVACPMPHVGMSPGRDAVGGDPAPTDTATGSISVVNDSARGVAVYVNESGQRIDVAAAEYDGGPLVTCVDVSDFSVVTPNGDTDALPAKAIVVGTRDDGSPGVWQINADDSISLPQPEQSTDNTARSIISGDMTSLPDGLQLRFGWSFKSLLTANGGKLIVGYAEHRQGFTYNGVAVAPGTRVAVYWRVSPLPFTRLCIVSMPRVIGIPATPPRPSWWPHRYLSNILVQLKQFLQGKYEAYLVTPEFVVYDPATGNFTVKGSDDEGVTANAKIDRNTVASIIEVPDLAVKAGSITFAPSSVTQGGTLSLGAVVTDLTEGPALGSTLRFYLSTDQVLDSGDKQVADVPVPAIDAVTILDSPVISATASIGSDIAAGSYYIIASVTADNADGEVVTTNNTLAAPTALMIGAVTSTRTYSHLVIDTYSQTEVGPFVFEADGDGAVPVPAEIPVVVALYDSDGTTLLRSSTDTSSTDTAREVRMVNGANTEAYSGYGYIDYTGGLTSGTYYVRVSLGASGIQPYAIRVVLNAAGTDYARWVYSTTPSVGTTTDDAGPGSAQAISIDGKAAEVLSGTGAASWFAITLP